MGIIRFLWVFLWNLALAIVVVILIGLAIAAVYGIPLFVLGKIVQVLFK